MNNRKLFFIVVSLLVLLVVSRSATAVIAAHVDRQKIALGESVTLTLSMVQQTKPDLSPLQKDFQIYGERSSSSVQINNGKRSASYQLIITLMPKRVGVLRIPPLTVGNDQTQAITITVTKPSAKQIGGNQSSVFLIASLSDDKSYVNSPVIYSLKLYYDKSLTSGQILPQKSKDYTIASLGKGIRYTATVNDRSYQVVEQKFLLTATKSGELTIPAAVFRGSITDGQQNNMGFFAMTTGKPITVQSKALTLQSLAIPSNISPANWFPAKSVQLDSRWSPQDKQLKVGEPITRTITLTASGIESRMMPDLDIVASPQLNAYPDKTQSSDRIQNNTVIGQKVYKIAYIPTQQGSVTFPAITLRWWDSQTGKSKEASLPAQSFQVVAGAAVSSAATKTTPVASVQTAAVAPTATKPKIIIEKSNQVWLYSTCLLLLLWLITVMVWFISYRRRKSGASSASADKQSAAIKAQQKKINTLSANLQQACQTDDARKIQQALLAWSVAYWQDNNICSLYGMRQHISDAPLLDQLTDLERAVYCSKDHYAGEALWHSLENWKKQPEKLSSTSQIKPFYPD